MAVEFVKGSKIKELINTPNITLVNVYADWCGPCKMFAPVLEEISNSTSVFKVNIDENKSFANEMKVTGVPTTFIYKNGILKDTFVGFMAKDIVDKKIEDNK